METNIVQNLTALKTLPNSWDVLPFNEVIKDVSGGNKKTLKSDFLDDGAFAIVDQGQSLIAGYTNNQELLVKSLPPYVVFGDHTRIFKYIDVPFAMGADGTKVLKPKGDRTINEKYLYYFFLTLDIPNTGYNRHFKYLKTLKIPLPPLAEQQKIAAILDAADSLRQKDRQLIDHYTTLSQSLFLEMFGDPVTNPMGWVLSRIDALCTIVRGSSPRPKGDPRYYGGNVPRLMVADLTRDGKKVTPRIDFLTEEGAKKSRPTNAGTVVMAVSGNVGLTSILSVDACIHDGFIAFNKLCTKKILPEFFVDLMMFLKSTHASRQAGAIFKNLTTSQMKEMEIPLPAIELQIEFCNKIKIIEAQKQQAQASLEKSEALFNSLLQRAFSGELTGHLAA